MPGESILIWIAKSMAKRVSPSLIRLVLSRSPLRAERRFRALREPLAGVTEQATEGAVSADAKSQLALRLEWLDIWPRGIRGERATRMVGPEADYLYHCTETDNGLQLARQKFPKDGPQEWGCWTDSQGEFMGDKYSQDLLASRFEPLCNEDQR